MRMGCSLGPRNVAHEPKARREVLFPGGKIFPHPKCRKVRSSRRESALIPAEVQIARIHARCYEVHGEGGAIWRAVTCHRFSVADLSARRSDDLIGGIGATSGARCCWPAEHGDKSPHSSERSRHRKTRKKKTRPAEAGRVGAEMDATAGPAWSRDRNASYSSAHLDQSLARPGRPPGSRCS